MDQKRKEEKEKEDEDKDKKVSVQPLNDDTEKVREERDRERDNRGVKSNLLYLQTSTRKDLIFNLLNKVILSLLFNEFFIHSKSFSIVRVLLIFDLSIASLSSMQFIPVTATCFL